MPSTDLDALQALLGPQAQPCRTALTNEHGTSLPPLNDHHVHLHLAATRAIVAGGISAVLDLGGDPVALARRPRAGIPRVHYAGAFLTAPGGYPIGRSWAPAAIVREVRSASDAPGVAGGARTAVDEQADAGASVIKVALDSAGPVLDAETLQAIIAAARSRGLSVVAHVEGDGMTRRSLDAGVDVLAHAPFTEVLDAVTVAEAAAAGQRWVSTLTIHGAEGRARAIANVAAFALAGGTVLYGTDLGNGDWPAGVREAELAALHDAGVRGPALVASLSDPWPSPETGEGALDGAPSGISTFVPGAAPHAADGIPAWLARARVVPTEELVHDER